MKKLIVLVVIVAAGFVVFNQITKDKSTAEEHQVEALAAGFKDAQKSFGQAGLAAGTSGADTTSDAASAVAQATEVKRKLDLLLPALTEEKAKQKAEALRLEVDRWVSEHR